MIANTRVALRACRQAVWRSKPRTVQLGRHLDAAYQWLCAAQDATPDGGVSGCYNLVRGWAGSYAETTGYIIPTFLHYGASKNILEPRVRAIRMADWECEVQLSTGAVRSGMLGTKCGPAVFNSGQVLFGWIAAHQAVKDPRYAAAAASACRWLVSVQDSDGAWRKNLSVLTTSSVQTYNVRAAWGLAMAGVEFDEPAWKGAAIHNCDWALSQQRQSGWFACNAFADGETPLLHTIGYVVEGLVGVGELLGVERYTRAAMSCLAPLVELQQSRGKLFGRYDENWRATVSWRCLTGEAQIALVLLRLARVTGEKTYSEVAQSLLKRLAQLQDLSDRHPESYGAIAGSQPLWGGYGPFNYLNWAAKFFMDALLLHESNVDVQRSLRAERANLALPTAV